MSLSRRVAGMFAAMAAGGMALGFATALTTVAARLGALTEDLGVELDHIAADTLSETGETALRTLAAELAAPLREGDLEAAAKMLTDAENLTGIQGFALWDRGGALIVGVGVEAEETAPAQVMTLGSLDDPARWRVGDSLRAALQVCDLSGCSGYVSATMDGWALGARQRTALAEIDAATTQFWTRIAETVLAALGAGVLIAALFGLILGRRIVADLHVLAGAMHEVIAAPEARAPKLREREMRKLGGELDNVADALADARADVEEIFERIDAGILVIDPDFDVLRANAPAHEIAGRKPGTLPGMAARTVFGLVDCGAAEELAEALNAVAELKLPDGSRRAVMVSAKVNQRRGEKKHVVALLRDATELEKKEAELSAALKKAEGAVKAKEAFLRVVNHELRTPLHGILGGASVLAESAVPEESKPFVQMIQDSGKSLLNVVSDVVNYARLQGGEDEPELAPLSIDSLAQSIAASAAGEAAAKGLDLVIHTRPGAPQIMGDRKRLLDIGAQLAANAVKFTDEGQVALELEVEMVDGEPVLSLAVRDTGRGIPEDQLEDMFGHFTQANSDIDRAGEGFGLGLAIVRKTADLIGAELGVESELGEGSTFRLRMPTEAAGEAPERGCPLEGRSALVVAENADQAEAMAEKLRYGGAEVTIMRSVAEAEAALADLSPELILASEGLEGLAGSTLAERMAPGDAEGAAGMLLRPVGAKPPKPALVEGAPVVPAHAGADSLFAAAEAALEDNAAARAERAEQAAREARIREVDAREAEKRSFRNSVILADPSDVSRIVLASFVKKCGFTCRIAVNGYEALKLYKEGPPALLIMDVAMPVMSGLEAAHAIRRLESETLAEPVPILGMTGSDRDAERERCQAAGMNDILVKPVKLDALEAKVARWTEEAAREQAKAAEKAG